MTDDKFREWCRGVLSGHHDFRLSTGQDADIRLARIVANRLLELLPPADDGVRHTVEWLESVGGKQQITGDHTFFGPNAEHGAMIWLSVRPEHTHAVLTLVGHGHGNDLMAFVTCSTRGHVRRLCKSLGLTLTEPK